MSWHATVLSILPDMFPGPLAESLCGRALEAELWRLETLNIRDFSDDKHRTVDDQPYGGGPGMVMRPDVLDRALAAAAGADDGGETVDQKRAIIYLTPRGTRLDQRRVRRLAASPGVVLACGRFEGVDQRVLEAWDVEEVSLGDFVLAGGELAAMALIDACVRLLPGVMRDADSLNEESFETGLLEYPHYTRPQTWQDRNGETRDVPDILVSGDHGKIGRWRREQAERVTKQKRPDLWQAYRAGAMEKGSEQ